MIDLIFGCSDKVQVVFDCLQITSVVFVLFVSFFIYTIFCWSQVVV